MLATLGERLKYLRETRDLTQKDVAAVVNGTYNMISCYERDKSSPDVETLAKLCDFFNVSADYLLGRLDRPHNYIIPAPPEPKADEEQLQILQYFTKLPKNRKQEVIRYAKFNLQDLTDAKSNKKDNDNNT